MKKFKGIASKKMGKEKGGKVLRHHFNRTYVFWFNAKNLNEAIAEAKKIAKRAMSFESLKVSEV